LYVRISEPERANQLMDSLKSTAREYAETDSLDSYRGIVDEMSSMRRRLIDGFSRLMSLVKTLRSKMRVDPR